MELEQLPVGQIRIDINEFCEGEVHITVDNQYRNMGLASKALFMLEESIKKLGVNFLIAHIKPTNINSVILFIKSGFIFSQLIYFKGFMCYELKKEIV
jgi:RimJ/RimL family protein N-acetyltransferase